jgi:hypothetical protein
MHTGNVNTLIHEPVKALAAQLSRCRGSLVGKSELRLAPQQAARKLGAPTGDVLRIKLKRPPTGERGDR